MWTIAMGEIAEDMREGLLALAVGAGLHVMASMMEADVAAVCGPRGRHDPERKMIGHGTERASVTLGGRRTSVQRPRMRGIGGEVPVPSYELFSGSEILGRTAMSKLLGAAGEPGPGGVDDRRRPLRSAPVRRGMGMDIDGTEHPLGLVEDSTENTNVVTDLLTDLRERGLDTTRPILVGIDVGKALHAGVVKVFDHAVIQRCQAHKCRNVADKLPDELAKTVTNKMRATYQAPSAFIAEAQLQALAGELEHTHPGAAASLHEGLAETLTVLRLGVPPTLVRTLGSTNCIESMISICRNHLTNVKNWQSGDMALRWCTG